MATIVTRAGKGLPLTNAEVDANFTNLNNQLATALFGANNLSDLANVSTARSNLGVAIGTNVQAWDADLDAIAALTGTAGFLKKTAANTWALDTSTYLTGASGSTTQLQFNSSGAFAGSANLTYDGTVLRVGAGALLGGTTNPVVGMTGSANNYIQSYIYNSTNGASASADFVAYASNSTDAHGWADMGFTGPTYADPVYTVTGPNEAYVFGSALNSSFTGNLVYATDSTGSANAHQWYVGGFTQAKSAYKMQLGASLLDIKVATTVTGTMTATTFSGAGTNLTGTAASLTAGAVSSITSSQVTTALGYTPPQANGTGASGTWAIGISGTAAAATNVAITADTTTATAQFLAFMAGTSGNGGVKAASGLTYTPSTGLFAATKATFTPNTSGVSTGLTVVNGDITTYRSGGTTGVIYLDNTGTHYLYFDGTNYNLNAGNLICTGNITAYSDESVKTNWRALPSNFLEMLAAVQNGIYDRTDAELTQEGVSAQSLQRVLPHSVMSSGDGTLSVNYGSAALVSVVEIARELVELKQYVKSKLG